MQLCSLTDLLVDFISTKNVEFQGLMRRAGGWLAIPRFVMTRFWGFPQNLFKSSLIDLIVSGNYSTASPTVFPTREIPTLKEPRHGKQRCGAGGGCE